MSAARATRVHCEELCANNLTWLCSQTVGPMHFQKHVLLETLCQPLGNLAPCGAICAKLKLRRFDVLGTPCGLWFHGFVVHRNILCSRGFAVLLTVRAGAH